MKLIATFAALASLILTVHAIPNPNPQAGGCGGVCLSAPPNNCQEGWTNLGGPGCWSACYVYLPVLTAATSAEVLVLGGPIWISGEVSFGEQEDKEPSCDFEY
ncbi:hypothetical protein BJ165DRAFT_1403338 [Panaeolus papilionaceus]|nr:hypothetical protein BJ165DRAFT_1403338 [Panaeolus papilionaceus]